MSNRGPSNGRYGTEIISMEARSMEAMLNGGPLNGGHRMEATSSNSDIKRRPCAGLITL